MPKLVNHDNRKKKIAEATWQVILDNGMAGATVRNIAKEAGLSPGALRYYFKTQDELLVYAMGLVKNRATKRIEDITKRNLPAKEMATSILLEIVPTNAEKRAEMEVWLAFVTYMKPKKHSYVMDDEILKGIAQMMQFLSNAGVLHKHLDMDMEIEKLYAFIDGLALHALIAPKRLTPSKIKQTIIDYLKQICVDSQKVD